MTSAGVRSRRPAPRSRPSVAGTGAKRLVTAMVFGAMAGACAQPNPYAGVTVAPGGHASGAVGIESGRVRGGVTTGGTNYAGVDVVQRPNASVSVGTGGASATIGNGPVRLRVGRGMGVWL